MSFDHEPPSWEVWLLHDPQTSGGLLMAVAEADLTRLMDRLNADGERAWVIGTVDAGTAGGIIVRNVKGAGL